MKKRNEWITKAMKRCAQDKDKGIVDLILLIHHFFKDLPQWIEEMTDTLCRILNCTVYDIIEYVPD